MDSEDSIARTGRDFCDKLFAIEAELDSLANEERYNKHLTQEKEVFEAFWSWAEKIYPTVLAKTQCRRFVKTYELIIPEPRLGDVLLMGGVLLGGYFTNSRKAP